MAARAAVAADQGSLCLRHAPDRGGERRDRDPRVGHRAVRDGDDGRCADDGDLHLPPVLEPEVGAARAGGRGGNLDLDEQLVGLGGRGAGARPEVVDRDRSRAAEADCSVAVAPKQMSGPPVSIAGEAFITLPPMRALRPRGVGADDRAGIGERGEARADVGARGDLRDGSRARRAAGRRRRATRRRGARRRGGSRRCCPGARDLPERAPTTRSVPPATGRAPLASAATASSTEVAAK